jgi:hypothetical protein
LPALLLSKSLGEFTECGSFVPSIVGEFARIDRRSWLTFFEANHQEIDDGCHLIGVQDRVPPSLSDFIPFRLVLHPVSVRTSARDSKQLTNK